MKNGKGGLKVVSNYQRLLIKAVIEHGTRSKAASALGISERTLDDAVYRAFKALNVNTISDAYYLVTNGVFARTEEKREKELAG